MTAMTLTRPLRLLHETLERTAHLLPDKTAIVCDDETLTFRELDDRSNSLAAFLQSNGVARGDRVAVFMENSIEAAVAIYAILKAGAAFVLVNPQTKQDKLAYVLRNCDAKALVFASSLTAVAREAVALANVALLVTSGADPSDAQAPAHAHRFASAIAFPDRPPQPKTISLDLAALIYTSGSTGNPKGVMHTHQSMLFALCSIAEYLELSSDDVILNVLPLAFDYGLYQLLMAVYVGAQLVLERSFTYPGVVLRKLRSHGVTVFPGVPTTFAMLTSTDIQHSSCVESVRRVTNTGAALPPAYLTGIQRVFPNAAIYAMYGLTECKRVSFLPPEKLAKKPESVGKAIPGTETLLLSPEGEPVPTGAAGILHVRGAHMMLGYWNDPDATAKMLVPGPYPGEKLLRTGDWFKMDEEGDLYFLGRSDDIIKSRGEKISPVEIEAALLRVEGVREAAVIGVPDDVLGEAVKAFVTLHTDVQLSVQQIQREVRAYLEAFMIPKEIVVVDKLPTSLNGKFVKAILRTRDPKGTLLS